MTSWQVNSELVYLFLAPILGSPGLVPGTPEWDALDDCDPEKLRACHWPTVYWAVGEDARQTAMAEASREISAAADWRAFSTGMMQRRTSGVYIPRKVA